MRLIRSLSSQTGSRWGITPIVVITLLSVAALACAWSLSEWVTAWLLLASGLMQIIYSVMGRYRYICISGTIMLVGAGFVFGILSGLRAP